MNKINLILPSDYKNNEQIIFLSPLLSCLFNFDKVELHLSRLNCSKVKLKLKLLDKVTFQLINIIENLNQNCLLKDV